MRYIDDAVDTVRIKVENALYDLAEEAINKYVCSKQFEEDASQWARDNGWREPE